MIEPVVSLRMRSSTLDQKLRYESWPKSDRGFSGDPVLPSILLSS